MPGFALLVRPMHAVLPPPILPLLPAAWITPKGRHLAMASLFTVRNPS